MHPVSAPITADLCVVVGLKHATVVRVDEQGAEYVLRLPLSDDWSLEVLRGAIRSLARPRKYRRILLTAGVWQRRLDRLGNLSADVQVVRLPSLALLAAVVRLHVGGPPPPASHPGASLPVPESPSASRL